MRKLLAIIKREYLQRVRTKMFIVATLLGPVMVVVFAVVPGILFGLKAGDATRLAIVDESGKLSARIADALAREDNREAKEETDNNSVANAAGADTRERLRKGSERLPSSFKVEMVALENRSLEDVRRDLNERLRKNELDGYLVLPRDVLQSHEATYYARNTSDMITREQLENHVSRAVREQRMRDANIDPNILREMDAPVHLSGSNPTKSVEEKDSGEAFYLVFIVGFLIYLTLIMYGQLILAAVVEDKDTRIAEVLFSSVKAFTLMMGKLIGVSLVALTQYAVWAIAFAAFALYGVAMLAASGMDVSLPHIAPSVFVYFLLFFLMGYFIYATIYALVGSMVTTTQEGGQVALPVIFLLMMAFYLAFPVIRAPDSSFAFWLSMVPFFSPILMLVRIVTQTPPFWQIALSLLIGLCTIVGLIWLAARIYRTGMLMYGKRATIPEVIRWVRQA
ncbi:MAG: ABC transporter permease [Pyrinomonadaceae bacterium]